MTKLDRQNINNWFNSINSLLGEISTVEISTTIVDEITEDIFIPYEVYRSLYSISPHYLAQLGIDVSLHDRYLQLRRQLELQYALLLSDRNSILYDKSLAPEVTRDLPTLANHTTTWDNLPCRLPPVNLDRATENEVLYRLLAEPHFKTILQQLGNIKASLDRRNLQLSGSVNNNFNLTYAQTIITLDGKISNRYASEIIEHPQKKEILKLHQQGVEAGTKRWYNLLRFVTEIIQRQFQQNEILNDSQSN